MKKKINIVRVFALTFLATSLALFNFDSQGWRENEKSYLGIFAGLVLLLLMIKKK